MRLALLTLVLAITVAACAPAPAPTLTPIVATQPPPPTLPPTAPPVVFVPLPTPRPERAALPDDSGPLVVVGVGADGDLYGFDAANPDPVRLTVDPLPDSDPAWNVDGSRVFFTSERDGTPYLYSLGATNANPPQRVSAFPVGDQRQPTLSPDGFDLAFTSSRGGADAIYRMSIDGRGLTQLTINPTADYQPSWSPDNTWIAHTSERDGNAELYIMDTNGGQSTRLTDDPARDDSPSFSPDGRRLAFVSDRSGTPEIYFLVLPYSLEARADTEDYGAAINPIAGVPPLQLDTAPAELPRAYQLTSNGYPKSSPQWYIDENGGYRLVYAETRPGPDGPLTQVYTMNDDGTDVRLISEALVSIGQPSLRPVSKSQ